MGKKYSKNEKKLLSAIGDRIRSLRSETELSQEKLAFKCELDRTYIGSVERGERNISAINLKRISDALEIPIVELFKFSNES